MKRLNHGIKWTMAAVLIAGIMAVPAFAEKTTPATGKNSAVPAVPRAIPDLLPYHKFDPPKSKLFDINKLTISGDLRVRPEFRNNGTFGIGAKNNTFIVQQWARLGFNYSISPDVTFFLPPRTQCEMGRRGTPSKNQTLFARQGSCWCGISWCRTSPSKPGGNWWSGATIACSGISTGTTMGARRLDRELQAQQEHHPASGLVADGRRETVGAWYR